MSRRYYQISTADRTAEIDIYGDITSDAEILNNFFGDTGARSARGLKAEIDAMDVDVINVYINSYGGEVAEALAIYSALQRHKAEVHTFCDGFACSAATIIFCAGDTRTMGSIALMMIHNCMSYLGYANSEEMRKAAEDNDKINQSSIEAYKKVSNLTEKQIRKMMDKETWLSAEECLQYGFATEIAKKEDAEGDPEQTAFPSIRKAILDEREDPTMTRAAEKLTTALIKAVENLVVTGKADPDDPDDDKDDPDDPDGPNDPDDPDDTDDSNDPDDPDDDSDDPDDPDDDKDGKRDRNQKLSKIFSLLGGE